jgi:hypothetical protein
MKKSLTFATTAVLVFSVGGANAQDEDAAPPITPVDTYTCNYNEGKGPADLDKAIDGWNAWMDKQGLSNYYAMTMTPHYFGPDTFQVGWLGFAPTAEELGAGADNYAANGRAQAAAFSSAITCDTHSNFASVTVKQPPERKSPDSLVVAFSDCSVADGVSMDDVFGGLAKWTAYQTEMGYQNGSWAFFPAYGGGGEEFDMKMVSAWDSHADRGKDYDLYANGGGYQKRYEIMGNMLSCDSSRVYDGVVRRRIEAD